MDLMHMIGETSLMMGFTFIVGMAFAYVLKLMTFFFSRLNGTEISALLRKGRIWGRAYRMDIARTDRYFILISVACSILKWEYKYCI